MLIHPLRCPNMALMVCWKVDGQAFPRSKMTGRSCSSSKAGCVIFRCGARVRGGRMRLVWPLDTIRFSKRIDWGSNLNVDNKETGARRVCHRGKRDAPQLGSPRAFP